MFVALGWALLGTWFGVKYDNKVYDNKELYVDPVQKINTMEFFWEITNISERLTSKELKLATVNFNFTSRSWSAVLEWKNDTLDLTLSNENQIILTHSPARRLFFLGVGIKQSTGQTIYLWNEVKVVAPYAKQAPNLSWSGPSRDYLLKNKDLILSEDALTFFVRISTYPSTFCIMAEKREGYNTNHNDGTTEDKSGKQEGEDRICVNCKVLQNLSKNLKDLYSEDKDHDIIIIVRDKYFGAHRSILKARSPFLAAQLSQEILKIQEDDCDPEDFAVFLLFLYSGTVDNLNTDNVISLYNIANKYEVPDLMETCASYMVSKLTVHSVSNVISVSLKHKDYKLLTQATLFFLKNAEKIFPTAEWQTFLRENPTKANQLVIQSYAYKPS